ncbi:hypothetical protein FHX58_007686 [Paraburkholderia tropica]|nr:hypothetical protein [Paraburkholderia tropica]
MSEKSVPKRQYTNEFKGEASLHNGKDEDGVCIRHPVREEVTVAPPGPCHDKSERPGKGAPASGGR